VETEESGMSELSNTELNIELIRKASDGFAASGNAARRAAEALNEFGRTIEIARRAARKQEILRKQMRLKLRGKNWRSAK
jgi:hypothetical protein